MSPVLFNFEKAFRCDIKDTSESDAQRIAHLNLDAQDSAHLNAVAQFSAQQDAQDSARSVRSFLHTKPIIKPRIEINKTTTPTPPPDSIANNSKTIASGGGGGLRETSDFPRSTWQVKEYLRSVGVMISNPVLFDKTVDRLITNGWRNDDGSPIRTWRGYITTIATNMAPAPQQPTKTPQQIEDEEFERIKRNLRDIPED